MTTGHQLCLFTGPLYFIYKIISTINLSENLQSQFPDYNFVPIFWLASEDHDFKEINHLNIFGKKVTWYTDQKGAVGRMNTKELESVLDELKLIIGTSINAEVIIDLFKKSYLSNSNLSESIRCLVNEIFGKYGIVIIDGDDKKLKREFLPIMKKDLCNKSLFKSLISCSNNLSKYYKNQAYIREINFFKISKGDRSRVLNVVSENEVDKYPELFSPNVLMRPIYQETILPNLAYVGGGSELSYWMQLKDMFDLEELMFPILILRNSVLWIKDKDYKKFKELGFKIEDIFKSDHDLQKVFVDKKSSISLAEEKQQIISIFNNILEKNKNSSLRSSIESESKKQLIAVLKLEKKLLKLEKQKHTSSLNQISKIKNKLFPSNIMQERQDNFISMYLNHGEKFIEILKEEIDPLDTNFLILSPKK